MNIYISRFLSKPNWILPGLLFVALFIFRKPVLTYLVQEREKVQEKSKAVTLSYFLPPFSPFASFVESQKPLAGSHPGQCVRYYDKALNFYPHLIDAHAMLGLCHYYNGDIPASLLSYQKAVASNPHFFWNQYNLGVLYYKMGQYSASTEALKQAVSKSPEMAFKIINVSAVYKQIWRHMSEVEGRLLENFRLGLQDAYALLVLDQYHLKNFF